MALPGLPRGLRGYGTRPPGGWKLLVLLLAIGLALVLLLPLALFQMLIGGLIGSMGGADQSWACNDQKASKQAEDTIPDDYLAAYQKAGRASGIPWAVLAAIGKVETDHGRANLPGVRSGTNYAGAAGPMQFLLSTWRSFGVDGDGDGRKDVYDPADAIPAAAGYLKAHGAPQRIWSAIFAYNHADWYVADVLDWAKRYTSRGVDYVRAGAVCAEQVVGKVPGGVIGTVIAFARAQLGKPYLWGGAGPDAFDCSGLMMMAYRAAGINIPRTTYEQLPWGPEVPKGQEQPGDLVFFGSRADPHHVGLVIGKGMMIEAPRTGDVVKISSYQARRDIVAFTRPAAHRGV